MLLCNKPVQDRRTDTRTGRGAPPQSLGEGGCPDRAANPCSDLTEKSTRARHEAYFRNEFRPVGRRGAGEDGRKQGRQAEMALGIAWERRDEIAIAILRGRIDGSATERLQDSLESGLAPEDRALILDFEQVSYINSSGLRVGLRIAKHCRETGRKFGYAI